MFGTLQGRLPQELRLAGITDMEEANRFLKRVYLPQYNANFAIKPTEPGSAFVSPLRATLRTPCAFRKNVWWAMTIRCATKTLSCKFQKASTDTTTSKREPGSINTQIKPWQSSTAPASWQLLIKMEKQQTTKTNWLRDPHRRKPTYLTSLQSHTAHSSLSNRPTTEAVNSYGT
jgi:hypothetical protein